jgi:hypothetical protein
LFKEIVQGNYYEVINQADEILKTKEISIEKQIEALLAKSWSFHFLARFEFREDYKGQALKLIKEAYHLSSEIDETVLIFDTLFMRIRSHSSSNKHKEVDDNIELAIHIYERIEKEQEDYLFHKNTLSTY